MSLLDKHRGKFFVLIAGIIIFAHAVIPHHHHFDSIESHWDSSANNTPSADSHEENPETHCHAFNMVVVEKSNDIAVQISLLTQPHFDLFNSGQNECLVVNLPNTILVNSFCFPKTKAIYLIKNPQRGPPTIA